MRCSHWPRVIGHSLLSSPSLHTQQSSSKEPLNVTKVISVLLLFYGSIFLSQCGRSFLTLQRHLFVFEQAKHVLWRTWFICWSWILVVKRSGAATLVVTLAQLSIECYTRTIKKATFYSVETNLEHWPHRGKAQKCSQRCGFWGSRYIRIYCLPTFHFGKNGGVLRKTF